MSDWEVCLRIMTEDYRKAFLKKLLGKKTKLNLGSGKSTAHHPDYLQTHFNVDICDQFPVDLKADMMDLDFEPEVFDEILISDCLDHVSFAQARTLLRRIVSWLKPGGSLTIHTPNLRFLAWQLSQDDNHECLKWLYATDGEGSTNYPSNVIRWAYSRESLEKMLKVHGLRVVDVYEDCGGFALQVVAVK